jgi:predicted restriction endonuclease
MTTGEIRKLDALWAKLVKERAGYKCEYCQEEGRKLVGPTGAWLEAAHIVGRTYRTTRWRLDNGMCLCSGCHRAYDEHRPIELQIRRIVIGEEKYERLCTMKQVIAKNQDYDEIKKQLENDYVLLSRV